jgi:tRNA dimethylallyltransferase
MPESTKPKIIIILGPTASGKTALSLGIAPRFGCEIISADSMQVYRGMDIGSAKLSQTERASVVHHLIDIVDPDYPFNVADFRSRADRSITEIYQRGKLPLICGGTGLYINSLVYPYNFSQAIDSDPQIRQKLHDEFASGQGEQMHSRLQEIDPLAAAKIHANDARRLLRALEIHALTGKNPSEFHADNQPVKYQPMMIGLTAPRDILYQRIELRVEEMIEQGLVAEVEKLLQANISRGAVSMQGLGYKQIAAYLAGECSLAEAIELMKRDTRRFAKRQMTWFKRDPRICWFDIVQYLEEGELVNAVSFRVAQMLEEV